MTLYKNKARLPNTENIGKKIVSIPMHPNLSNNEIDMVIKSVNEYGN